MSNGTGTVRIGVIGYGGMGSHHAKYLSEGKVPGAVLAGVADLKPSRLEEAKKKHGEELAVFETPEAMMASKQVDAVMIATPHYDHPPLAMKAFEHGLHALVEKPAGVYTRQVRQMNEAAGKTDRVFGVMFNQRTRPAHQKLRELVQSGELGELRRVVYFITNWLRTQAYYDSGDWRGTWAGEGGGVLMNQAPHNIDLFQWICGMPTRCRAFLGFGRHHDIEVEDDVTAYFEYANQATGLFVTTTGEAPGTTRMEISGDRGRVLFEGDSITFWQTRTPVREHIRTCPEGFGRPETWKIIVPPGASGEEHIGITKDWVKAIREGTKLLAPGVEGIHGVQLANAMLLSGWTDDWVNIPVNEEFYYEKLQEKIKASKVKKESKSGPMSVAGTF